MPSVSSLLGREAAAKVGGNVTTRDVATGIPAIDSDWTAANFTPADERTADQKDRLALSDSLIAEVQAADTLILSVPMYNFGVPSTLKAWIDHICRAGLTFKYSAAGPEGLLTGKRAILVVTTGGTPAGSDMDFVSSYVRHILGFIGITDVTVIASDLLLEDQDKAIAQARKAIADL
jgi:FMN-dependent NADH-azoreductase